MIISLKKILFIILIVITSFFQKLAAQAISNIREKEFILNQDTLLIDSLSLVPNSEIISLDGKILDATDYEINYIKGVFVLKNNSLIGKQAVCTFRVLPYAFDKEYSHKKIETSKVNTVSKNPFLFEYSALNEDVFYLNGLNKSGSISRGVVFGNNQGR